MYTHLPINICLLWSNLPKCPHWQRQCLLVTNLQIFTYLHTFDMVKLIEYPHWQRQWATHLQIFTYLHTSDMVKFTEFPHWQRQWATNVQTFTNWHVYAMVRFTEMSTLTASVSVSNKCTDIYSYGQIYRNVHINSVSEQQIYRHLPIYIRLLWSNLQKCPH